MKRARKKRAAGFDFHRRSSGILLHITSLPGTHGNGDLGPEAHSFIEVLVEAGQRWWQMLPIGPPGRPLAFSPYDSASAFAGSPWLVSLATLAEQRLLAAEDLKPSRALGRERINFPAAYRFREIHLCRAFENFQRRG